MKIAGLLLSLAGWTIVLAAVVMLAPRQASARTAFVLAGLGVEGVGLTFLVRAHLPPRGHRE